METFGLAKTARSQDSDVIFHLCEKLRLQTQLLTETQQRCAQYETQLADSAQGQKVKELEKRLAELTKPIPMSDSLSFPPPSVSLSLSQLMELYSLLYVRMNELLKEREELQSNLHEEILFSEEQSVILETMREEMSGSRAPQYSESVQTDAGEPKDTQEPLNEALAEISKLEEEKNALLEYVEQQAEQVVASQADVERLEAEVLALRETCQSHASGESATAREAFDRVSSELETLRAKNAELQAQADHSSSLLTALQAQHNTCAHDFGQVKADLNSVRMKYAEAQKLLKELQEFRQSEEEAALEALHETQSTRLEEDNKSLRRMLSELQAEMETMGKAADPRVPRTDQSTLTDPDPSVSQAVLQCQSQLASLNASFSALLATCSMPST